MAIEKIYSPYGPTQSATTAPQPGAAEPPNEPTTLTLRADALMDEEFGTNFKLPAGWTGPQWADTDPANHELFIDSAAPVSGHFLRFRYPQGMDDGVGPMNFRMNASQQTEVATYYCAHTHRLVDHHGDGEWEGHPVATKQGWHGVADDHVGNEVFPGLNGVSERYASEFHLRIDRQNNLTWQEFTGVNQQVGQWYLWEFLFEVNDIGSANGTAKWWLTPWNAANGVWGASQLILDLNDVEWRDSSNSRAFYRWFRWNPTWGGNIGITKDRDDYIDISHVRVRGD